MKLTLLLNRNAGTLRGKDPDKVAGELAKVFRDEGHQVEVEVHGGRGTMAAIERICAGKSCDALIVGGGDGTISAAAGAAAKCGVTLGILPLGTMNLFARSLGIPLEVHTAAAALAGSERVRVDIGEANGHFFVHHVALGLHPRMIRVRERLSYGSRLGKIWASVQAGLMVLRQPPRLSARIRVDDQRLERRTSAILVSNNPLGEGHLPYADDPRQGVLGLYVARSRRWQDLLQLAARVLLGGVYKTPLLESWQAKSVEIDLERDIVNVSLDGELVSLSTPLRFRLREGGLAVLKPRPEGEAPVSEAVGAEPLPEARVAISSHRGG